MMVFEMYLLSNMAILGIHVSFRGCKQPKANYPNIASGLDPEILPCLVVFQTAETLRFQEASTLTPVGNVKSCFRIVVANVSL